MTRTKRTEGTLIAGMIMFIIALILYLLAGCGDNAVQSNESKNLIDYIHRKLGGRWDMGSGKFLSMEYNVEWEFKVGSEIDTSGSDSSYYEPYKFKGELTDSTIGIIWRTIYPKQPDTTTQYDLNIVTYRSEDILKLGDFTGHYKRIIIAFIDSKNITARLAIKGITNDTILKGKLIE